MPHKYEVSTEQSIEVKLPKKYKVLLLNDDYTSMDFVIEILKTVFSKSNSEAEYIMLTVHEKGQAVCGVYSYEIAETKVVQVSKLARDEGFPLRAVMEES
jgi:ATP-dependent Clp protease adaptor protein ClpS